MLASIERLFSPCPSHSADSAQQSLVRRLQKQTKGFTALGKLLQAQGKTDFPKPVQQPRARRTQVQLVDS